MKGRQSEGAQMNKKRKLKNLLLLALAVAFILCAAYFTLSGKYGFPVPVNDAPAGQEAERSTGGKTGRRLYDSSSFLNDVPEWQGYAFCYINDNRPDFKKDEIWTATRESLEPLDSLGRCGAANSCIGPDGMPSGPRGDISSIEPTGWHTERYDFVEGEMLFNRCHLIGHQLSGDDAIPRNLITGTSYMNRDGMLPFENAIAAYVRESGNHVMYRVTPVFRGKELIARGVHMEAVSVEDKGEGVSFNVFCYNVQPGIDIDYATGDNRLSDDTYMLEQYLAGRFAVIPNTRGSAGNPGGISGAAEGEKNGGGRSAQKQKKTAYVLNTNTGKFHYPDCSSVKDISEHNKLEVEETREDLISRGFEPCGSCRP